MAGQELQTCDVGASISKHLELLIMTRFGHQSSDPTFGCEIWDLDFELIVSQRMWEEKMRNSIEQSILMHEPRLSDVSINISLSEVERLNEVYGITEIKKRVELKLRATIKKTGEPFGFTANIFLSPLSID